MKKQEGITAPIEPEIGISSHNRQISIAILNNLLADEMVLLVQTLNYHWNLVGPQFNDYHALFNKHYHDLVDFNDDIAERTRSVGGTALGTMADFIKNASLKEDAGNIPEPRQMVRNLLKSHESIIRSLRNGINETALDNRDIGTSNFLTDLMEKHEKIAWMLRSLAER